jgi:hypothetical protein
VGHSHTRTAVLGIRWGKPLDTRVILEVGLDAGPQASRAVAVDDPNRARRGLGKVLFQNRLGIGYSFPP